MDQSKTQFADRLYWKHQRRRATRSQLRLLKPRGIERQQPGESRLLVIPHDGPLTDPWTPLGGNIFFEIQQSASEHLGRDRVRVVSIPRSMPSEQWLQMVVDEIVRFEPTHVLGQVERDPNKLNEWNWDVFATWLRNIDEVTFVAVYYDLSFGWIQERIKRLHKVLPTMVSLGLGDPPLVSLPVTSQSRGPVTMPISEASLREIDLIRDSCSRSEGLSFLGALYDDRIPILASVEASGMDVAVNPHHEQHSSDYLTSRENKSNYSDYMRGLASSTFTLNFAQASSGPDTQYKTRVVESAVLGTFLVTDDTKWAPRLLSPELMVVVKDFCDIAPAMERFLQGDLDARRRQLVKEGKSLAKHHFWGQIEDSLVGIQRPRLGVNVEACV